MPRLSSGLYIVATPIGNLNDITYRAVDILKSVDLVLSEDTRQTKKLFDRYKIETPLKSYRDQNHTKIVGDVLDTLCQGNSVCLVSDSGTPLISDPGYKLVREVISAGYNIIPIPGPSAVIAALSASGLPTDKFCFLGFLPKSTARRAAVLKESGQLDATLVLYESPYRVAKLLTEIYDTLGNRQICVAGELTKVYEKFERGSASELIRRFGSQRLRGEYTVLVSKVVQ